MAMKVLQVINSLGTGGAEKLILDTLPLYKDQRIDMDVLLLWDNECSFTNKLQSKNCCKIYIIKKTPSIKAIYNPFIVFKISKIIKNYDIVHVHLFPAQYFVVFANWLNGKKSKLVFTEHSTSNRRMLSSVFKLFDRAIYKHYSKIIAISGGVKKSLLDHLHSGNNIEIITNGVNLSEAKLSDDFEDFNSIFSDQNIKKIIQIGGFRIQKDQDTTIRALLNLPDNYHLLLVGDGERRQVLKDLVEQLSLSNRVHFFGTLNNVFSILKMIDVVVVSSHAEGFGLVAVEAMASNKPIIASDVPGLSEVVKGAGILFPVGDEIALAREISKLLEDSDYYEAVVTACLERAAAYDITIMVDKHIDLYKRLAKS